MSVLAPSAGYNFTSQLHNDTYPFIDPAKLDLSGKVVMVTGASRGIGRATCLSFARAGASGIILAARSSLEQVVSEVITAAKDAGRTAIPKVLTIKLDTTNRQNVEEAAKRVEEAFGKLDILVNNAGYLESFLSVVDSDPDEWWKTYDVNVRGLYLVTRSFLPLILKSESKTIVQLSSIGAHLTWSGGSGYNVTKLVGLRFGEVLMEEHGNEGLVTYGVHPGAVLTALAKGLPETYHGMLTDTPELSGDTIAWLTSESRRWLAGRYMSVAWDMEELLHKEDEIVRNDLLKVRMAI